MKSESLFAKTGFVLLCFVWGSTWLAIKIGLESVPPFYGVLFRFLIAVVILYAVMKWRGLRVPRDRVSWNLFLAVGILSFGLPFNLLYWSGQFLPSGLMSILFAIFPFIVAFLSHIFLPDEPLNIYKVTGIILGFSGIVAIFSHGISVPGTSDAFVFLGMTGVIISTFLQASSIIIIKKRGKEMSPVTLNFGGMLIGVIMTAIFAFVFEKFADVRFDLKAIGSIVFLSTFGSVLTFVIYFWLLKRVEAVFLSLITFVTPIIAVFLGVIVLGEKLEPNTFLGAGLVLLGILVANGKGLARFIIRNKETVVN